MCVHCLSVTVSAELFDQREPVQLWIKNTDYSQDLNPTLNTRRGNSFAIFNSNYQF